MGISRREFGVTKGGEQVYLYTISGENGMEAVVTNFGAALVSLMVPDTDGVQRDLVLGFDRLEDYEENSCFFGVTVGRSANRIGGASFELDGVRYELPDNENGNNLHTDLHRGFHKKLWDAELLEEVQAVKFSYVSPDGENGFPGTLQISVTYTLLPDMGIQISYDGVSDKKTMINMTNHSYFNLCGHDAGSIEEEKVTIFADCFTELGPGSVPSGKILQVEGTPMDLRNARRLRDGIDSEYEQIALAGGYDHNWVLHTTRGVVEKIALVEDEKARRVMEVWTDLPGVQFYTGNFIMPQTGKGGAHYERRCALCLETQYFPNSINIPEFVQPIFEAGQPYHTTTIYRFRSTMF